MKPNKIIIIGLCLMGVLLLSSCIGGEVEETSMSTEVNDTIKPIINIDGAERTIYLDQGDDYDWMKGISGFDNVDGDITDRIRYELGDFDHETPGEYEIWYYLTDLAGNEAEAVKRTVIVRHSRIIERYPIYLDMITDEAAKPTQPACFPGAWYHKVVSSRDQWLGIEGKITLPEVIINRYDGQKDPLLSVDPNINNLDNPSIYLGGNAKSESDVGLSLSLVCLNEECTSISRGSYAFRPFWRYITDTDYDEGSLSEHRGEYAVSCTGTGIWRNCYANWNVRDTQYYYLPGDKLRIIVYSPKPEYLQLQIEVIEVSSHPKAVEMREKHGWKQPENFVSPLFRSPGHGTNLASEYKRVNAIDQSGNEGKPAIDTTSEVNQAIWHESYLYRKIDGKMYRVPLTEERTAVLTCPDASRFTIEYNDTAQYGGEIVSIHPGRKRENA